MDLFNGMSVLLPARTVQAFYVIFLQNVCGGKNIFWGENCCWYETASILKSASNFFFVWEIYWEMPSLWLVIVPRWFMPGFSCGNIFHLQSISDFLTTPQNLSLGSRQCNSNAMVINFFLHISCKNKHWRWKSTLECSFYPFNFSSIAVS